jgi:hypothetical protein
MAQAELIQHIETDTQHVPVPAVTPMQMLQLAVEKGASIEMMERLLTLQERWESGEARKAFVVALSAFKAEPPTIVKDKSASFDKGKTSAYSYARLDQVAAVIGAALSKHGLSSRWETSQADGKIRVTCVLTHAMGHSEKVSLEAGADTSGSKNAIQAIGSAVSYLERYTLLAITGLAASDQDDDGDKGDRSAITAEQKDQLIELIKDTNADTRKFLAFVFPKADPPITTLDEIPVARFPDALAALQRKKAEQKDGK